MGMNAEVDADNRYSLHVHLIVLVLIQLQRIGRGGMEAYTSRDILLHMQANVEVDGFGSFESSVAFDNLAVDCRTERADSCMKRC
jgi:hypothetical protein